jgi:hypothetical protein
MTATYNSHVQSPQTREHISNARAWLRSRKDGQKQLWSRNRLERSKRTPEQQLATLDFRLGKGEGAVRERKKLKEQIANRRKIA